MPDDFFTPEPTPIDLIARFGTCSNYPRNDPYVLQLLTISLAEAGRQHGVKPASIVQRCIEISNYCPTEHDFLAVAQELKQAQLRAGEQRRAANQDAEWKRQYGEPKPFDWKSLDMEKVKRVKDRERALLSAIKAKYPGELSWHAMAEAARELGYEDYAKAWGKA